MANNSPYISLSVIDQGGKTIKRLGSHKSRRIFRFIQTTNFYNTTFDLCVTYPNHQPSNCGTYTEKNELAKALKAFLERDNYESDNN